MPNHAELHRLGPWRGAHSWVKRRCSAGRRANDWKKSLRRRQTPNLRSVTDALV